MKMNHLHIKAHNVTATSAFYKKYFGFTEAFPHESGEFLMDEFGFLLAIFPYSQNESSHRYPEWFHFGFCVEREDIARNLYKKMRQEGVDLPRPLKEFDDGTVNFYCQDPAGHKIEVAWHPDEAKLLHPSPSRLARVSAV